MTLAWTREKRQSRRHAECDQPDKDPNPSIPVAPSAVCLTPPDVMIRAVFAAALAAISGTRLFAVSCPPNARPTPSRWMMVSVQIRLSVKAGQPQIKPAYASSA